MNQLKNENDGKSRWAVKYTRSEMATEENQVEYLTKIEGVEILHSHDNINLLVILIDEARKDTIIQTIEGMDEVVYVCEDVIVSPTHDYDSTPVEPNDPKMLNQDALQTLGLPYGWRTTVGSKDVLVGILDSGIALDADGKLSHQDLQDTKRIELGKDWSKPSSDDRPKDEIGHGTAVASIVGASTNNEVGMAGVNWNCRMYITKVGDDGFHSSDVYAAADATMDYARRKDITKVVLNLSGGVEGEVPILESMCLDVKRSGALLVASAWNHNSNHISTDEVLSPARYSHKYDCVIGVGGCSHTDPPSLFKGSPKNGTGVSMVAPAEEVLCALYTEANGYTRKSGVSFATPYVSGIVALIWSRFPTYTAGQVKELAQKHSIKPSTPGQGRGNSCWGHGIINASDQGCLPPLITRVPGSQKFNVTQCIQNYGDLGSFSVTLQNMNSWWKGVFVQDAKTGESITEVSMANEVGGRHVSKNVPNEDLPEHVKLTFWYAGFLGIHAYYTSITKNKSSLIGKRFNYVWGKEE
jgi:subtilisin family serine protease